jgi:hypothetical protein
VLVLVKAIYLAVELIIIFATNTNTFFSSFCLLPFYFFL